MDCFDRIGRGQKKDSIYFVVLHYEVTEETIRCVESILDLSEKNAAVKAIVVDNGSPNSSGLKLKKHFAGSERVEVLISEANVGFARGNNIGYRRAKDQSADYIVLINNDTIIRDKEFASKIIRLFNEKKYGVLGPDIFSVSDGVHQNPMKGFSLDKRGLRKRILRSHAILLANRIGFTRLLVVKSRSRVVEEKYRNEMVITNPAEYVLHGSCLIFSPVYINRFDGLFEGTFMYCEENILAYQCFNEGVKMLYSPTLAIDHYRGVATRSFSKREFERIKFKHSQIIASLRAYQESL